jgi:polysaccharide export outer membrane protein
MPSDIPDRSSSPLSGRATAARWLCALFAAALAGASASPAQTDVIPAPSAVDTARPVGPLRTGDLLTVAIEAQPEMTGQYLIDNRGFVSIPGLGRIPVAGKTPDELYPTFAKAMRDRGIERADISITVQIRVFVHGQVGSPGLHPVEPGANLLSVLAIAGGPTPAADLRHSRVIRGDSVYHVDLESGLEGSGAGRIILFSNDHVVIERRRGLTAERLTFLFSALSTVLTVVNIAISMQRN